MSRAQADELFYRELLADGDGTVEAKLKWSAVRMFASGHYGTKAEWPKFIDDATLLAWESRTPIEPLPLFGGAA